MGNKKIFLRDLDNLFHSTNVPALEKMKIKVRIFLNKKRKSEHGGGG